MYQFPIGIMLDSLRTDAAAAIQKAAELGAGGLQMYATSGEFAPENMSAQKRRELLDMVNRTGLYFLPCAAIWGKASATPNKTPP